MRGGFAPGFDPPPSDLENLIAGRERELGDLILAARRTRDVYLTAQDAMNYGLVQRGRNVPLTRSPSLTRVTRSAAAATSPAPSDNGTTPSFVGPRPPPLRTKHDRQTLVEARDHIISAHRISS
jgi:hypothetical protein